MLKRVLMGAAALATVLVTAAVLPVFAVDPPAVTRYTSSIQGQVKVVTSTQRRVVRATVENPGWLQVPGAETSITIPEGETALVEARFSARAGECWPGYCLLRIRVAGGPDYILEPYLESSACPSAGCAEHPDLFDGLNVLQNVMVEKAYGPIPAGKYTVRVEFACAGEGCHTRMTLTSFLLTVERLKI
jgi:hypothetical protein